MFRRSVTTALVAILTVSAAVLGTAAPAAGAPPVIIPKCATMFSGAPSYWSSFSSINGDTAVITAPTPRLYGSDVPYLKTRIRTAGATTCTWMLEHGKPTENFTISVAEIKPSEVTRLQRWFASSGIAAVDSEATLGGVSYRVSATEMHLFIGGRVWVAIKARNTSVFGYTMQAAAYTIAELNPSL